jgi:hypothetical protein
MNPATDDIWTAFVEEALVFFRQHLYLAAPRKRAAPTSRRKD